MRRSLPKLQPFLTTNILSLLALVLGLFTLAISLVGPMANDKLLLIIVTMLSAFILTELLERYHLVAKVDGLIDTLVANGLDDLLFDEISATEAERELHSLLISSQRSVHWAAPEPRRGAKDDSSRPYEEYVTTPARDKNVHFSWITRIDGAARASRAKRLLFSKDEMPKTFVGSLNGSRSLPAFTVMISDEKRMLLRIPRGRNEAGRGNWITTGSKPVVEIFLAYFDSLIEDCKQLESTPETEEMLERIGKRANFETGAGE